MNVLPLKKCVKMNNVFAGHIFDNFLHILLFQIDVILLLKCQSAHLNEPIKRVSRHSSKFKNDFIATRFKVYWTQPIVVAPNSIRNLLSFILQTRFLKVCYKDLIIWIQILSIYIINIHRKIKNIYLFQFANGTRNILVRKVLEFFFTFFDDVYNKLIMKSRWSGT